MAIFTTETPASASFDSQINLGTVFTVSASGWRATGGRYYRTEASHLANGVTLQCGLWDGAGALVASGSITVPTFVAAGWLVIPFAAVAVLSTGQNYTVGAIQSGTGYFRTASGLATSITNGVLSSVANGGRYLYGTTLARPTGASADNYFVDVDVEAVPSSGGFVGWGHATGLNLPINATSPAWVGYSAASLLTGWEAEQQMVRPAQQAIVTAPLRTAFDYTARFIVAPGDYTNAGTAQERSEVYASVANSGTPAQGMTMWWGWSVYFPVGFQVDSDAESPVGNGWIVTTQLHGAGPTGNPNVDFSLSKGTAAPRLIVHTQGGAGVSTSQEWMMAGAFPIGQWVDMRLGLVFGETVATGRITVKQDGVTIINNATCANLFTGESAYFKQGLYRATSNRTHTVYYTGTRRGPTEASVTL